LTGAVALGLLLASEPADPVSGVTGTYFQYGVLGATVVALGIMAYKLIQREQKRGDALDAMLAERNKYDRDTVIPALVQSQQTLAEVAKVLPEVGRLMTEFTAILRERERR
jgi:hypothetical protein